MTDTPYMSLTREQADVLRGELDTLRARVAELERQVAYEREQCAAAEVVAMKRGIHANALRDAEVLTLAFNELSRLGAFVPGGMDMARALAAQEVNP